MFLDVVERLSVLIASNVSLGPLQEVKGSGTWGRLKLNVLSASRAPC